MKLTPDQAYELSKLCKKYYKAVWKYSDHLDSEHFQDCDEAWEEEAYNLEQKKLKAQEKLEKHLDKLIDTRQVKP